MNKNEYLKRVRELAMDLKNQPFFNEEDNEDHEGLCWDYIMENAEDLIFVDIDKTDEDIDPGEDLFMDVMNEVSAEAETGD